MPFGSQRSPSMNGWTDWNCNIAQNAMGVNTHGVLACSEVLARPPRIAKERLYLECISGAILSFRLIEFASIHANEHVFGVGSNKTALQRNEPKSC